jgi:hypothetical protein
MIKKISILICLLSFPFYLKSQVNLVPNPSFEDTAYCPMLTDQVNASLFWQNYGNSPDYFNSCSPAMNVPNAQTGFQYAHSGNAMMGLVTYVWPSSPGWPSYREYIGTQLLSPLVVGQKYYLSFYINFAGYLNGWQKIGADKLGLKFSTVAFSETAPPPLE